MLTTTATQPTSRTATEKSQLSAALIWKHLTQEQKERLIQKIAQICRTINSPTPTILEVKREPSE